MNSRRRQPTDLGDPMFKFFPIAALTTVLACTQAQAQEGISQSLANSDGEYVTVGGLGKDKDFLAVVAVLEKAGYKSLVKQGPVPPPSGTKTDTWCNVSTFLAQHHIVVECYTPRVGRGVSVHDHFAQREERLKGDYSGIMPMIMKVHDEHRRVSAALGIKSWLTQGCLNWD